MGLLVCALVLIVCGTDSNDDGKVSKQEAAKTPPASVPGNAIPKFVKDMNMYLEKEGKKVPKDDEYYIHYAYCPKCVKKYGHQYMILFARI